MPLTSRERARIAGLRSLVATFSRGGEYRAAALALQDLSRLDRASGLSADAVRRAWQSAALTRLEGSPADRAQALLHLGTLLLEHGDARSARELAELSYDEITNADAALRDSIQGCAALIAGVAARAEGDPGAARPLLDEARERLASVGRSDGAALALAELAQIDLAGGNPAAAEVCFSFAREFHRLAGSLDAAAQLGAAAAQAFIDADLFEPAARWCEIALGDAEAAGDARQAILLAGARADCLERTGAVDEAVAAARDAAHRCERGPTGDPEIRAAHLQARLTIARLATGAEEVLRHLEIAFDLALLARDEAMLGEALDRTVAGLVDGRFPASAWGRVDRFHRELTAAGIAGLAEAAAAALAELR